MTLRPQNPQPLNAPRDPESLQFTSPTYPLILRLIALLGGLPFVALGLSMLVTSSAGLPEYLTQYGVDWTIVLVVTIGLVFTLLGGLGLWAFAIPSQILRLDTATRRLDLIYRYPFGIKRRWARDLSEIRSVAVSWNADDDMANGGCWSLDVALPERRTYKHFAKAAPREEQKAALQSARDKITRAIGGAL